MEVMLHEAANTKIGSKNGYTHCSQNNDIKSSSKIIAEGGTNTNNGVKSLNMLTHNEPMEIVFENVTYSTSLGFRRGRKEILHKLNGRFPAGQLIAIMGPSGAGKSTLLDVLSGYRISGIEGSIYVNGTARDLNSFRKSSCYIMQDDRLQPLLSVWESMKVVADLKLGTQVSTVDKEEIIKEIVSTLGLENSAHTKASRLSGGQRKRLSIALELTDNPLVMFLDEPTTGLDSSSCSQCVKLLKQLARQGRTIVCTIHQPSASLFQLFDQVYVLASGNCVYQGTPKNMIPYLEGINLPCPKYHNPADYIIELACGEYGSEKIEIMVSTVENGKNFHWFDKPELIQSLQELKNTQISIETKPQPSRFHTTSQWFQLKTLLSRNFLKTKRDKTLTYMRIIVNILVGILFGTLYWQVGSHGNKVLDNYNLLFSIIIHHMMSTMMLTILTFPTEMLILTKEHFNRWYSLKMYYVAITIVDFPISIVCCVLFTMVTYFATGQPVEISRISMFIVISILIVLVAQGFGLMIGAIFNVVNGTFIGPCLSVPMMMFAGFGVPLRDLPPHLHWGSYLSYLRYGLEGLLGAIYGLDRPTIYCPDDDYCHFKYPAKFLSEIGMVADQFWNDVIALILILIFLRTVAFFLLKFKVTSVR